MIAFREPRCAECGGELSYVESPMAVWRPHRWSRARNVRRRGAWWCSGIQYVGRRTCIPCQTNPRLEKGRRDG